MKVLLEKLNKKFICVSTMVMVLIVLICHVFMLEEKIDKNTIMNDRILNIDNSSVAASEPIVIDYYIRIVISGTGNIKANVYKNDGNNSVDKAISDCIDISDPTNIIITNLNIVTTAQYGIIIYNEVKSGNVGDVTINMAGNNSIVVNGSSSNVEYCGIKYAATGNHASNTNLAVAGDGSLNINVTNSATNGKGYGIDSDTSLNISVGNLSVDATSQAVTVGGTFTLTDSENSEIKGNSNKVDVGTGGVINPEDFTSLEIISLHTNYYLYRSGNIYNVDSTETLLSASQLQDIGMSITGTTLTLNGFKFTTKASQCLKIESNVTLNITGTNNMESKTGTAISVNSGVILSITGIGTMELQGETSGINSLGTVSLTEGFTGTITAKGNTSGISANAMTIKNGNIVVNKLDEMVKGLDIGAGELIIGDVGNADGVSPTVTINGDWSNTSGIDMTGSDMAGIYVNSDMKVYDGLIDIDLYNTADNTYITGVRSAGTLYMYGGTLDSNVDVYGEAADTQGSSDGIYVNGLYTEGGNLIGITDGINKVYSAGIHINTTAIIKGGVIRAENTNENDADGNGIYTNTMTINGGSIIARGKAGAISLHSNSITLATDSFGNEIVDVIAASLDYSGTPDVGVYDTDAMTIKTYKYIEIGRKLSYYLNYVVADGAIYKGTKQATTVEGSVTYNTFSESELGDMGITLDTTHNVITLSGSLIEMTARYGLYIDGNATIHIADNSINKISAVYNRAGTTFGIFATGDLNIEGNGTLEIISENIVSGKSATTNDYGIYTGGKLVIENEGNTTIRAQGRNVYNGTTTNYGVGINAVGTVTVNNGEVVVQGDSKVSNKSSVTLGKGNDYDMQAVVISSNYDGNNMQQYPDEFTYNAIKYVEWGKVANYYFKFNVNNGTMTKVSGGSTGAPLADGEVVSGWRIEDNALVLDEFNFVTSASKGIDIVSNSGDNGNSDVTIAELKLYNDNSITTLYNTNPPKHGISITGGIVCTGVEGGKLTLEKYGDKTNTDYTGIETTGNITIESGNYNITGATYGINSTGDITITGGKCNISGATGLKQNNANILDIRNADVTIIGTSGPAISATSTKNIKIFEKVMAKQNYTDASEVQITDMNTSYASKYSNYQYFNMSPAVMSVDITWGSMQYAGEAIWNPTTHRYDGRWEPFADGTQITPSDQVIVKNNQESNIPVVAGINYNPYDNYRGVIVGNIINGNKTLAVSEQLESRLELNGCPADGIVASGINIGSVVVTLSD